MIPDGNNFGRSSPQNRTNLSGFALYLDEEEAVVPEHDSPIVARRDQPQLGPERHARHQFPAAAASAAAVEPIRHISDAQ